MVCGPTGKTAATYCTCAQALLLKVGVLGHVMPLLFGYDVTHDDEGGDGVAATDLDASASRRGPGFLGLSIERSNMQVQPCATLRPSSSEPLAPCQCAHDSALVPLAKRSAPATVLVKTTSDVLRQAARNHHARLAARALGRLAGHFGAPENPIAATALQAKPQPLSHLQFEAEIIAKRCRRISLDCY